MEDSKKKPIMVAVIIGCITLAIVITAMTRKGSDDLSAFEGRLTWVQCRNPECKAEYEMGLRTYYEIMKEESATNPSMFVTPPLVCKECEKESLYKALKCEGEGCGLVFESGTVKGDYSDRCPKCGGPCVIDVSKISCPLCGSPFPHLTLQAIGSGIVIPLVNGATVVGRAELGNSMKVSVRHAIFRRNGPDTWIESIGSNGTYRWNDAGWSRLPDKEPRLVQSGDRLRLGDVEFHLV